MTIKIKFIPTGLIFDVENQHADDLLRNEPENFEAVDGYTLPVEPDEPTIYNSIVVKEEEKIIPKKNRKNRD